MGIFGIASGSLAPEAIDLFSNGLFHQVVLPLFKDHDVETPGLVSRIDKHAGAAHVVFSTLLIEILSKLDLKTFGNDRSVDFADGNFRFGQCNIELFRAPKTVEKFFEVDIFGDHPMNESGELRIVLNLLQF